MSLETLDPAAVEDVFTRHDACSVSLSNAGDDPVLEPAPGETPLWSHTRITGLFPDSVDLSTLEASLLWLPAATT